VTGVRHGLFRHVRNVGQAAASTVLSLALALSTGSGSPSAASGARWPLDRGRESGPIVRERAYAVNARIRPLLVFWIGRDDVGDARIVWRGGSSRHRAIELLVGTDPERAPRRINRWGYIAEEIRNGQAQTVGVMTASDEDSLEEARASTAHQDPRTTYKASRTTLVDRSGQNVVVTLSVPARFTYRDVQQVLDLASSVQAKPRAVTLPEGAETGFLLAADSLAERVLSSCRSQGRLAARPASTRYLYNRTLYELSIRSCQKEARFPGVTGHFSDLVEMKFVVTNTQSREETPFRVLFGTTGDLEGVPVQILFRPKWWLEVELVLRSGSVAVDSEQLPLSRR
jgi:hypothetical protein